METSLKDHPLTRYHGGHNERYYHRLQHSEVQLSRHSYQDSINKCVLRTMKTIIPIKNYPGDCWNLTKISYIGWLKFLKYACILNKKFAYRFHIYSALHEWVFIHTEVITGKLYAVKKVWYIYIPIHIKALADGLNSLARNPTANPKATPTMVKMTSRLVLTTSKHFIFAPDMYYEPAAADTLIQKEVAVVNPWIWIPSLK